MASGSEIREHLAKLLAGQLSLDDFEGWFASYSWNIHKHGDEEAQRIAYAIEHELALFEEDSRELRQGLTALALAFAVSSGRNKFGRPVPLSLAESNSPSDLIRVAA